MYAGAVHNDVFFFYWLTYNSKITYIKYEKLFSLYSSFAEERISYTGINMYALIPLY